MGELKCLNPWDPQSKRQYRIDGVYRTLDAGNGAGGQAHGIVYAIEGNTVDRASGKNGKGWCENVSPTLNTQDKHAVVYGIDAISSNSWKSKNKHSGIHEMEVCKCLDTMCLNPSCNQGGGTRCIALEGNGARPSHQGTGISTDGTMYTLNTIERHSVCYENSHGGGYCAMKDKAAAQMIGRHTQFRQADRTIITSPPFATSYSVDCRNLYLNQEISGTLQAKNEGGHSLNFINPILKVEDE